MASSKVLVVDDDPAITNLVRHLLKTSGIEADTTGSADDALARMETNIYSIVLLDIHMPGMSGVEAISAFKQRSPLVQVIMLTGDVSVSKVIECVDRGAIDFFSKTENLAALPDAVYAALAKNARWLGFLAPDGRKKTELVGSMNA